MRKIWARLHRYLGLAAALFLLQAALSGCIIAYQQELDAWLNPELFDSPAQGPMLDTADLLARLQREQPQYRVVSLPLTREPGNALQVTVRPADPNQEPAADELFVDPVSAEVLGGRLWGACCFERRHLIPFIYAFHYSLQLPGEVGLWVMGMAAIIWLFESLIGFYLTFPKFSTNRMPAAQSSLNSDPQRKTWLHRWMSVWRIKPSASRTRFNFDLHRAGGLWLFCFMLMLSVSAISLNLRDAVFEPAVSLFSDFTLSPFDVREQRAEGPLTEAKISFQQVLQTAKTDAAGRGWRRPPATMFYNAQYGMFGVGFGETEGLGLSYLYYDGETGVYLGDYVPGTGTAADVFEAWQLPLHSGRIIGLPGRILVSIIGIGVLLMAVTGTRIWLHKRKPTRARH
ncbi:MULTISPECIES: PepSY-associated TM helix domain-containing protein [Methylomicrobium]|uniref:Putative iron-regulated membrane protein n=1 Tax=Methylomicrobium album BG8 TaxID=686340 RepID=H8GGV9_METAL|nr:MULTISPECIES: PepSY-associated TM helix domain-containing protein [Methylomicrobium]EIC30072.1 putative iron-regulated membrane protein [Methylomicrobium album BG8]